MVYIDKALLLLPTIVLSLANVQVLAQHDFEFGSEFMDNAAHEVEVPSWLSQDEHTDSRTRDSGEDLFPVQVAVEDKDPEVPDVTTLGSHDHEEHHNQDDHGADRKIEDEEQAVQSDLVSPSYAPASTVPSIVGYLVTGGVTAWAIRCTHASDSFP